MPLRDPRGSLRSARNALTALRAGLEAAEREIGKMRALGISPSPQEVATWERMVRLHDDGRRMVDELERAASLRAELDTAVGRHFDLAKLRQGPAWLAERVAQDLGLR